MKINWIFFGLYFAITTALHIIHAFLLDPIAGSQTYLFAADALCQCTLETGLLILGASWIQRSFPRWMPLYACAVFFLFLSHLIDFTLMRFVSMSFWYAFHHFVFQETFSNFIELLIASNIPLLAWLALGIGAFALTSSGLFLYKWTNRWKTTISSPRFFTLFSLTTLALICTDYRINTSDPALCVDRLKKVLPWKKSLFAPCHPTFLLDAPLQSSGSEEELLSHLDSRAFSLMHRPDIYIFVTESLRNDFITEETTPHLFHFKQDNTSFHTTFSNANCTHLSWFSLFHSRFPFDWKKESLEKEKKGSLPLRLLKKMGYKIHVCSSASLHYYQMDSILFGENKNLIDSFFAFDDSNDAPYLKDQAVINHLLTQMQKNESGRLFIVFLDSTHFDYSWPKEMSPFTPYSDEMNYAETLFSTKCPETLVNRYRNAIHFIDSLFGTFTHTLETSPGGQDAVVVFTGDHGEEFYEQGNLFHTSELSYQQITPPLYYRFGKTANINDKVHCTTTCHMDIFPTLFHYLLGDDLMQSVLQGQSIFKKERWPFTLIARFNASQIPYEYCIHNDQNKLTFEFSNTLDPFASKELFILSTKNLHDAILPEDASTLQEEFGPALRRLFPNPAQ